MAARALGTGLHQDTAAMGAAPWLRVCGEGSLSPIRTTPQLNDQSDIARLTESTLLAF